DLRAVNNNILDMYQLKSLHIYLAMNLESMEKLPDNTYLCVFDDIVPHWQDKQGHFKLRVPPYDHVICCTGFNYIDLTLFDENCKPNTNADGKFPVLSSTWESSILGIYFIGAAMLANDRKAASGFIHGFRYNIRTLHHICEERYHGNPYPRDYLPITLDSLANKTVERFSIGDAIYQLNDFLCNVLVIPELNDITETRIKAEYYENLPKSYVLESGIFKGYKHMFVVVLAYGFHRFGEAAKHPNDFVHTPDFESANCHGFLNPVISYYKDGQYKDEQGLPGSLELRFDLPSTLDQNPAMVQNRVKNFLNKYLDLEPGTKFNDSFLGSKEIFKSKVIPFTAEELQKLPDLTKYDGCIPYTIDFAD
ncbi:FAD-dependent oxidoreductase domain-containing protein 2-like, partial [Saccoglossus kowalevskii]|uniref:FAD-dependent oxidoreductase domain-containing protein 2-like n=1 Tax=Saccoglossus kowalevskii TaxID=10224 RepID=A0ABM0MKI0_SACKO